MRADVIRPLLVKLSVRQFGRKPTFGYASACALLLSYKQPFADWSIIENGFQAAKNFLHRLNCAVFTATAFQNAPNTLTFLPDKISHHIELPLQNVY